MGDAVVASRIVQAAEVIDGVGVAAAVSELANHSFSSAPIEREQLAGLLVIDDAHRRGLLTLVPSVGAFLAASGLSGTPVLIRGLTADPIFSHVLADGLRSVPSDRGALCGWFPDGHGEVAIDVGSGPFALGAVTDRLPRGWPPGEGDGVLLSFTAADAISHLADVDSRREFSADRWQAAWGAGVEVDSELWAQLYERAMAFLVPEEN